MEVAILIVGLVAVAAWWDAQRRARAGGPSYALSSGVEQLEGELRQSLVVHHERVTELEAKVSDLNNRLAARESQSSRSRAKWKK